MFFLPARERWSLKWCSSDPYSQTGFSEKRTTLLSVVVELGREALDLDEARLVLFHTTGNGIARMHFGTRRSVKLKKAPQMDLCCF